MKVFRIIVSILLAVGSVAVIGLAVLRGMDAPEGKKITVNNEAALKYLGEL